MLRLIAQTIRAGNRARVPVSVCGELAGELEMTELLLGMGLRQYSMHPSQILPVKERLFTLSTKDSARLATRVLRQSDPVKIKASLMRAANLSKRHCVRGLETVGVRMPVLRRYPHRRPTEPRTTTAGAASSQW